MDDPRRPIPLLMLDVDGTIRHGKDELGRFVNVPDDVVIFPQAIDRITAWKRMGGRVVLVSNQGGIGEGHVSPIAVQAAMQRTVDLIGPDLVDQVTWCPHALDAGCWCRKPYTRNATQAVAYLEYNFEDETYPRHLAVMVGDRDDDRQLAENLGIEFMDAAEWREKGWIPPGWGRNIIDQLADGAAAAEPGLQDVPPDGTVPG